MARRNARTESTAPESTEENPVTTAVNEPDTSTAEVPGEEAVEATAEAVQEEASASDEQTESAPAEATEGESAPAEAKKDQPIDLSAFKEVLESTVAQRDEESNGDLPEGAVEPVQAAYRDLDGLKAKNAAKAFVAESMKDALNALNVNLARAYMAVSESLTAATGNKAKEQTPADPVAAFTERYQSHLVALFLVQDEAPEGVDVSAIEVTTEQVEQARALLAHQRSDAEDKGEAPESTPVIRAGVKIASGKAAGGARKPGNSGGGGGNSGPRRDIGEHIRQAFADKESGTFLTVAEITGFESSEYGSDRPSAGAVSARLFPKSGKSTLDFVTPGTGGSNGTTRGATKV